MEEKEYPTPQAPRDGEASTPPAADTPAAQGSLDAEMPPVSSSPADEEESAAPFTPPPVPDWSFGAPTASEPKAKKHDANRFFGVFGGAFAVCLALLVVLLFVGDAGIKIFRTLHTERTIFVREYEEGSGLLTREEAADLIRQSTVTVTVRRTGSLGIGSGFIYTEDGYICTNYHVVEEASDVQVILPDGEAFDATVVGFNADADVAVLKIDKTGLTPVKLGRSADALVGEEVVAVGTPAKIDYAGTATFGQISYTNRIVSLTDSEGNVVKNMTVIQTDTAVNNGNSGGPLANMYGEVIGIVVMKVAVINGTIFDGIGFALPIDGAKIIIDEIIENGYFAGDNPIATSRALLGVTGRGLLGGYWYQDPAAEALVRSATEQEGYVYIPTDGVYVTAVNGAGAVGKLRAGDLITRINGLRMYSIYDVIDQVNRYPINATVTITVLRPDGDGYTETTVDIVLSEE